MSGFSITGLAVEPAFPSVQSIAIDFMRANLAELEAGLHADAAVEAYLIEDDGGLGNG